MGKLRFTHPQYGTAASQTKRRKSIGVGGIIFKIASPLLVISALTLTQLQFGHVASDAKLGSHSATVLKEFKQNSKYINEWSGMPSVKGYEIVKAKDLSDFERGTFEEYLNLDQLRISERMKIKSFLEGKNFDEAAMKNVNAVNQMISSVKDFENDEIKALSLKLMWGMVFKQDKGKEWASSFHPRKNYPLQHMIYNNGGVCVDNAYALGDVLIQAGVPEHKLSVMYLDNMSEENKGHAVLVMQGDKGAFVLDTPMWDAGFTQNNFLKGFDVLMKPVSIASYLEKNPQYVPFELHKIDGSGLSLRRVEAAQSVGADQSDELKIKRSANDYIVVQAVKQTAYALYKKFVGSRSTVNLEQKL